MLRLSEVAIGESVMLEACELSPDLAEWVSAIGLSVGDTLQLLQRGTAGGPLHVRTENGVELAVSRDMAASLTVRRL